MEFKPWKIPAGSEILLGGTPGPEVSFGMCVPLEKMSRSEIEQQCARFREEALRKAGYVEESATSTDSESRELVVPLWLVAGRRDVAGRPSAVVHILLDWEDLKARVGTVNLQDDSYKLQVPVKVVSQDASDVVLLEIFDKVRKGKTLFDTVLVEVERRRSSPLILPK